MLSSAVIAGLTVFGAISAFIQDSMGGGGEIITPLDQIAIASSVLF